MKNINIFTRPGGYEGRKVAIMCQIITFPTNRIEHTNAYKNLSGLFDICSSAEACDFYFDIVENLYTNGGLTDSEHLSLRGIGRRKRLKLIHPEKPGEYDYTLELNRHKPDCQMHARLGHYGTHYYIDTLLDLKGRRITLLNTSQEDNSKKYQVTLKAFEKLKTQYTISMECLLD